MSRLRAGWRAGGQVAGRHVVSDAKNDALALSLLCQVCGFPSLQVLNLGPAIPVAINN